MESDYSMNILTEVNESTVSSDADSIFGLFDGAFARLTLENLKKNIGTGGTGGTNDYNNLTNQPFQNLDLSSDAKTLSEIGAGCYIVTKTGRITTAGGFSRTIGAGTEIIVVLTNKNGVATLCATFQDGANVYRIDDDAAVSSDVEKFLNKKDINIDISTASDNKTVAGALAVKEYIDNTIGDELAKIIGGGA